MSSLIPGESAVPGESAPEAVRRLRLHHWTDRAVVAIAITALASGFGQFGVVAALGDVSTQFGTRRAGRLDRGQGRAVGYRASASVSP